MSETLTGLEQAQPDISWTIHGDTVHGTGHSYRELFDRYESSRFGIAHASQVPRFTNYYSLDHDEVLADLGDDVHPVRHMSHTEKKIARPLLDFQLTLPVDGDEALTHEQVRAIRLAALFHDMGECEHPELIEVCGETVGDVYFAHKTDEHETAEARIRGHIYEKLYPDVPTDSIAEVETIVRDPNGSFEGRAFLTVEWIGYFTTGIMAGVRAFEIQKRGQIEQHEQRFAELSRLGAEVSARWHPKLVEAGDDFPYASYIADRYKPTVDMIQDRFA